MAQKKKDLVKLYGGDFATTYKPNIPIPPPPLDPFLLVPPVDFTPYVGYEPNLAEWKSTPPEIPFDPLKRVDLFDLFLASQQGKSALERGPITKEECERWKNVLTPVESARPEDAPIIADYAMLQEIKQLFSNPQKQETLEELTQNLDEAEKDAETPMEVDVENMEKEEQESGDLVHPDKPHLKPVKRQRIQMNRQITSMLGSVYFEDEVPDASKLDGAVLKAVNDPSLPTCTAGWLYTNHKEVAVKKLFREFEMEQANREHDLIALQLGDGEVVQAGVVKETFTVRKQRPIVIGDEDADLLERIPAEPELMVQEVPKLLID